MNGMTKEPAAALKIFVILLVLSTGLSGCVNGKESKMVHVNFTITLDRIDEMTGDLPPASREQIMKHPSHFLMLMEGIMRRTPDELLLLVDKTHSLSEEYVPRDLVSLDDTGIPVTRPGMRLRKEALESLLKLVEAAKEKDVVLTVTSAYRSYEEQKRLYNYWVSVSGQEQADRESARPGCSQHQLGTTIDFHPIDQSFAESEAFKFLIYRAHRYGFSLSYPQGYEEDTGYMFEPWHFRYMGRQAAFCSLVFFGGIQQHFLSFYNRYSSFFKENYIKKEKLFGAATGMDTDGEMPGGQ